MKRTGQLSHGFLLACVTGSIVMALGSGCAITRVHAGDTSEFTENTCTYCDTVVCAYWWGLKQPRLEARCAEKSMSEVKVQTNYGYALISVLTLGIVMPQRITWICSGIDEPTGIPGQ